MRSDLQQREFILAAFVILKTNSAIDGLNSAGGDQISLKFCLDEHYLHLKKNG